MQYMCGTETVSGRPEWRRGGGGRVSSLRCSWQGLCAIKGAKVLENEKSF